MNGSLFGWIVSLSSTVTAAAIIAGVRAVRSFLREHADEHIWLIQQTNRNSRVNKKILRKLQRNGKL